MTGNVQTSENIRVVASVWTYNRNRKLMTETNHKTDLSWKTSPWTQASNSTVDYSKHCCWLQFDPLEMIVFINWVFKRKNDKEINKCLYFIDPEGFDNN